jgi:lipooligosaccharide transport system permease protein
VAWATPLAHGVALARSATLGTLDMSSALIHVLVPCAYAALGIMAASLTLRQKLVV